MAKQLSKRCDGSHVHQHLEGELTKQAAYDPVPLMLAILRGIRDTADLVHASHEEEQPGIDSKIVAQSIGLNDAPDGHSWVATFKDRDMPCAAQASTSTFKFANGTTSANRLELPWHVQR